MFLCDSQKKESCLTQVYMLFNSLKYHQNIFFFQKFGLKINLYYINTLNISSVISFNLIIIFDVEKNEVWCVYNLNYCKVKV